MQCNVDPITKARAELESVTNNLSSAIAGDWDDEVKDSYKNYISQCKSILQNVRSAEDRMKRECNTISSINVDAIISKAEATCQIIHNVR